ncbi:polysaccharide biosynthesis tyrosine autokinase [Lysobacter enzymogenes]|uniref:Polysaccharide biosynthesis tyrosine autokinase n=1 Tax=Lysobacter enzymogenes TaxID=69 RepID=A0A3N2RGC0_LYSEN|nr:polysaccharide biosynthesis tyrosine autokinase [Lysobacter enzymogenes]ROU06513.1 polysaccharide biosynthesis tyrosine autokinase [Lysobacter enzymogenes]
MAAVSTTSGPRQDAGNDEIDLAALLGTLLDHKWLIGAATALGFALSVAYALLAAPVYQANAMVQVESKTPTLPGLTAVSQALTDSAPQAMTEVSLLTSRTTLGKAVDDLKLDLQVEPARFPLIGAAIARRFQPSTGNEVAAPWFGLNRYGWGGETLDIAELEVPLDLVGKPLTLIAGANGSYELFDDQDQRLLGGDAGQLAVGGGAKLKVERLLAHPGMRFEVTQLARLGIIASLQNNLTASEKAKDSGIIQLSYELGDPVLAQATLEAITRQYIRQNIERNSAEAANSLQFVNKQLPNVRRDLEKAEHALAQYQSQAHTVDITLDAKSLLDQIVSLDTSISQLRLQQAEVTRRYTPAHPAYKALMAQIGELEASKQKINDRIGTLPQTQQELIGLTREVQVSTLTYTNLLNQAQQLDIARAGTVGNARIVDRAVVDTSQPVKPKRALVVAIGTFLAGFLAVAYVFLRQMLNRGVEQVAEIEQIGLPVLASIPMSAFQRDHEKAGRKLRAAGGHNGKPHLLAVDAPNDLAIEAMRSLRTALHFARLDAGNNILMICGSSPGAGKTFVSTNLAATIAQGGQRVLLIDGDLRRSSLHKVLGQDPRNGLSDLLAGRIDIPAATRRTPIDNLYFIPRGEAPPNPSELLMRPELGAALKTAALQYDLVIVDTPPILAVTDAALIGRHAGTCLMVVRFGLNPAKELALAVQRFEQNGIDLKGAVFNAVERRHDTHYAYGYEYRSGA